MKGIQTRINTIKDENMNNTYIVKFFITDKIYKYDSNTLIFVEKSVHYIYLYFYN